MVVAPCKECSDRVLGCHDHCKRYKEFKSEKEKESDIARKQRAEYSMHVGYIIQQREKWRKRSK